MSTVWLKNFLGIRLTEFELLRVPRPSAEFGIHVTMRCVQTGTVLGSLLCPLALLVRNGKRTVSGGDNASLKRAFTEGGVTGALIGAVLGPVVTYLSLRNMSSVQLYDRCYRLRFDAQQLSLDRTCVLGASIGYLSSGSFGFVIGVDLALLLSNVLSKAWQ
ncbi:hypothetical protein Tcan_18608 [Toxocara canis]|uniref:Uncharacterized protein n=2 Tax=Toxocara canis TaxID=6265 RepID=A0A0B2V944_TOXCA|nr:hypothetical protein Tcan_18608 [Toxocara canis]VDM43589.1 unnamed protein product [Toxocara canis]